MASAVEVYDQTCNYDRKRIWHGAWLSHGTDWLLVILIKNVETRPQSGWLWGVYSKQKIPGSRPIRRHPFFWQCQVLLSKWIVWETKYIQ